MKLREAKNSPAPEVPVNSKYLKIAERLEHFRPGPDDHYLDQAAALLREADTNNEAACKVMRSQAEYIGKLEARIAELKAALRGLLEFADDLPDHETIVFDVPEKMQAARAALRKIAGPSPGTAVDMQKLARAALEGKDE